MVAEGWPKGLAPAFLSRLLSDGAWLWKSCQLLPTLYPRMLWCRCGWTRACCSGLALTRRAYKSTLYCSFHFSQAARNVQVLRNRPGQNWVEPK